MSQLDQGPHGAYFVKVSCILPIAPAVTGGFDPDFEKQSSQSLPLQKESPFDGHFECFESLQKSSNLQTLPIDSVVLEQSEILITKNFDAS